MGHRPKRPVPRKTESGLTGPELEAHLDGDVLLDSEGRAFGSEEERLRSWKQHAPFIMSLMGKRVQGETFGLSGDRTYFDYGTRPYSWWTFEATEPRRLLRGDPANATPGELHRGTPKLYRDYASYQSMVFESEQEFLQRHGLLTEMEKQHLNQGGA